MYIIMCYIPKREKWYFGTLVQWYFLVLLQEKMRAFFLCISKLNRNFDCVLVLALQQVLRRFAESSVLDVQEKMLAFSCVSQNLIVPLHLSTL